MKSHQIKTVRCGIKVHTCCELVSPLLLIPLCWRLSVSDVLSLSSPPASRPPALGSPVGSGVFLSYPLTLTPSVHRCSLFVYTWDKFQTVYCMDRTWALSTDSRSLRYTLNSVVTLALSTCSCTPPNYYIYSLCCWVRCKLFYFGQSICLILLLQVC